MARPSKETIKKRNEILELEIFKRNNEIYINFEDKNNNKTKYDIAYSFSLCCFFRNPTRANGNMITDVFLDIESEEIKQSSMYKTLLSIDKNYASYFLNFKSFYNDNKRRDNGKPRAGYCIEHEIEISILRNALSKKRFIEATNELINIEYFEMNFSESGSDFILTNAEKMAIINELSEQGWKAEKTLIHSKQVSYDIEAIFEDNHNKKIFAELDLTKSKEEILEYVSKLKDDFDKDPSYFKNVSEIFGKTQAPFTCNLQDCEVYKAKNPKPIYGRLADVLFIYDCMQVNKILGADILTKDYITDEITKYWRDTKNISTESFYSFDEYYTLAKEYIDNKRYKDYLSGIKTTPIN